MATKTIETSQPSSSARLSLRFVIIAILVGMVILTVGIVGYLSYRNSQAAVTNVASQLLSEVTGRVVLHLDSYLSEPHLINQTNADLARQELLDVNNVNQASHYFWQQGQRFTGLGTIAFANDQGEFVGANQPEDYIVVANQALTGGAIRRYAPDEQGYRTDEILRDVPDYDARTRGWYQTAETTGRPTWTDISISATSVRLDSSAVHPYYDEAGQFRGVFLVDVSLSQISNFLQQLQIGENGKVFIIDQNGDIVASSTGEQPFIANPDDPDDVQRLPAAQSADALIAGSASYLARQVPNLTAIDQAQQFDFDLDGQHQFLQIAPFQDEFGLDWFIVIAIPQVDFIQTINESTRNTILLTFGVLALAVVVGVVAANWITSPLINLNQAAKNVAQGQWDQPLPPAHNKEVSELAESFNSMVNQLRQSFETLEERVAARTRGLELVASLGEHLAGILDFDQLQVELVNRVQKGFGYYHTQIYMLDEQRQNLVMTAGVGQAGAQMKAEGYQLAFDNPSSLVARAARTGEIVSDPNLPQTAGWQPHPLLPETISEMAVPIFIDGKVVGVLAVQQNSVAALDEGDASLLRSVANQVATGIRNARQFEQAQTALAELQTVQAQYLEQSWNQAALSRFTSAQADVQLTDEPTQTTPILTLPIKFRQVPIGSLQLEGAEPERAWSEDELALMQVIVDQVAQTAENLRLFEETRQRAGQEQVIRQITDNLRAAPTLDALLETAARELGQQLNIKHTVVELGIDRS